MKTKKNPTQRPLEFDQAGPLPEAPFGPLPEPAPRTTRALERIKRAHDLCEWFRAMRGDDRITTADRIETDRQSKLGELLPKEQGKRTDLTSATRLEKLGISDTSLTAYRKVAKWSDKIERPIR